VLKDNINTLKDTFLTDGYAGAGNENACNLNIARSAKGAFGSLGRLPQSLFLTYLPRNYLFVFAPESRWCYSTAAFAFLPDITKPPALK
jgi:hypothetical protein